MSEVYCADCKFYDDEGHCTRPGGLLHGIRISNAMAEAEHDCKVFEEAVYTLREAAYLDFALKEEGIRLDLDTVARVCDRFFKQMMDAGLLQKGGSKMNYDITFCEGEKCPRKEQCHRYCELQRFRADKDPNRGDYIDMAKPDDTTNCTLFWREKGEKE